MSHIVMCASRPVPHVCVCVAQASLDQPTQTVVMHRTEPTSLQNMTLQLAEKLGGLVENNERVFDLKQGVYGGYFNRGAPRHSSYQIISVCVCV